MTSESVEMPMATVAAAGTQQVDMKKSKPGSGHTLSVWFRAD